MILVPGSRLGHYEILAPVGAGGMGLVFRARDTKLGREVAVKVVRGAGAADPAWRARFEREARVLAALNHPNVAAVYGFDDAGDTRYLVMELVPGESLADRLRRGPLPVAEALAVCAQVAGGLAAAHEQGIVHRDLKPANVMVTPAGAAKLLDFGLAKTTDPPAESGATGPHEPYEAQTKPGFVVGTPAYMSPEQARGRPLDRRCDLWALGCVLYEALTGRPAFTGDTPTDILTAVIERPPAWEALPAGLPPRARDLLRRCLQKDPNRRLRDAGDAGLELEEAGAEPAPEPPPTVPMRVAAEPPPAPARSSRRAWIGWAAAAAVLAGGAFLLGRGSGPAERPGDPAGPPHPPAWAARLLLDGPAPATLPRVSPDGRWLAFVVVHEGQAQVGVMKIDSGEWWVLTRHRDRGAVNSVCWAPDSARVYFDRFFDVPGGVYSASPHDRGPAGAREVPVLPDADGPQVVADGSLVVGKLDPDGNYQLHRYAPGTDPRPVGPPVEFQRTWAAPVRAVVGRNAVVFCGAVLDGRSPAGRRFYLLDLDANEYRPLAGGPVPGGFVPLAVSADGRFAYSVLPVQDVFHVVRIPLAGPGGPEPVATLTTPVWGLDADADGRLYFDQVRRAIEVLRFGPAGAEPPRPPEPVAAPALGRDAEPVGWPVGLADGRVVVPGRVAGRDRLMAVAPGRDPAPLLDGSDEETAPPVARVGGKRVAFVAGSGAGRRLRIATVEDDAVRLDAVELGVPADGLTALAAAPDGATLYAVRSRQVFEVPADGSRPPRAVTAGDGVAVAPATGGLVVQRFERGGVRVLRSPRPGDPPAEVPAPPGPWRLAPLPVGGMSVAADGVLVAAVSRESWFWRPAALDPRGQLRPIPAAFRGDLYPAEWTADGGVLGAGYSLRSGLWRMEFAPPP